MSQIQKKFIAADSVDDTKIKLSNNAALRARNAANSADVNLLKLDASNVLQFLTLPQVSVDPVVANDITRKSYVDALVNGLSWKTHVRGSTTAALPANTYANGTAGVGATLTGNANGALSAQDGVTFVANDRILVKNEATGANNGIYVVTQVGTVGTPYILTRASDMNSASQFASAAMFIDEGTSNAGTAWVQTTINPITVGTTAIVFAKFSSALSLTYRNGLSQTGSNVDVVPGDNSLTATPGSLIVKEDAAGAIVTGASGIKVQLESANPSLQIATNQLGVKLYSGGAITSTASGVGVLLESSNPTLQIASNALGLKMDAAGALATGAAGVKVKVDAATVKINGTDNLEALKKNDQLITLVAGDITNQYIDLAFAAYSSGSISLYVIGGPIQTSGVDFTVALTGGVAGVTRLTFAGDLATGGLAALVAGDKLVASYAYL